MSKNDLRQELEHLCRIFRANNFGITDSMVKVVGGGVYPLGALLNHSCTPNCLVRYQWDNGPPQLQLVAAIDIAKGDELTHSYVELVSPTDVRQSRLQSIHGFTCTCPRCQGKVQIPLPPSIILDPSSSLEQKSQAIIDHFNPVLNASEDADRPDKKQEISTVDIEAFLKASIVDPHQWQAAQAHYQQARIAMVNENFPDELRHLEQSVTLMQAASSKESPYSLELYQIQGDRLGTLLVGGLHDAALPECEHLVAFLCLAFFNLPYHPLLGLQLFTLGDLYEAQGNLEKAYSVFQWARKCLQVSHGPNDRMVLLLQEKLEWMGRNM